MRRRRSASSETAGAAAFPALRSASENRLSVFRAADAFAVEAYRLAHELARSDSDGLATELRRSAIGCGGALVAASAVPPGSPAERRQLERARACLAEARYYLYMARRFGRLDPRRYRALTLRQDAALRELAGVIEEPP